MVVRGFTPEVHRYLGVSDVFIGKPGPGSVSEALAVGLALLLDRKMVLPQERPQLHWLEQEGLGRGFADPRELRDALATLVAGEAPKAPHRPNRAALELPGIIAEILDRQSP